ncbi:pyrimidine reductase [Acrocarpospora corrugata]|uniref:Pyrimidine reductase n=1 Tax=Acrocarpospora corrugata TaxID=35763 RepID=A0A5M3W8D6_9ACTN|nr:dihydrofolate reductase family protein [Acrocarpospora corrugata]GES04262.1 pyrimidine reductase [Acrocarpospora corrugata]
MRKIVSGFFISLDGVVEAPHEWHFPWFSDQMGAAIVGATNASDAMLMGRNVYQEWAEYWPNAPEDDEFGQFINNVDKYVVSTTLTEAGWGNTTVIPGDDLVERITELKSRPGKDIYISGSPTLVRSLLGHGLVDELQLLIHPIIVGSGERLYEGLDQIPLKVVAAETFETGVLFVRYAPDDSKPGE